MGCDIHLYVERREGRKWLALPPPVGTGFNFELMPRPGKPWDQLTPEEKEAHEAARKAYDATVKSPWRFEHAARDPDNPALVVKEKGERRRRLQKWFSDRNYRLFGMLAGVRNTGGSWLDRDPRPICEPITEEPRGVPDDASKEYKREVEAMGVDGHSHSYATIDELRTYLSLRHTESYLERGVLDGASYEALIIEKKRPETWSGGISGLGIVTVDAATYNALRPYVEHHTTQTPWREKEAVLTPERAPAWWKREHARELGTEGWRVFVDAKWEVPYTEVTGNFVKLLAEIQETAGADVSPEDLRLVYFFDN
jgi:hypothetical protein